MSLSRAQLRYQAACARYQSGRTKPPTRKQAAAWLRPIRDAFHQMRSGFVDSVRGYAVTRLHTGDDYARIDFCINGFTAMIVRVMPDLDIGPMNAVSRKLAAGAMLSLEEIDRCKGVLDKCEDRLIRIPRNALIDAAMVEQINIEFEQAGIKEAA